MEDFMFMSEVPQAADALAVGLKRVTDGWCQHTYQFKREDGQFNYCLAGALSFWSESGNRELHQKAILVVRQALQEHPSGVLSPLAFNDLQGTTQADVIAVMQRAYDLALFEEEV